MLGVGLSLFARPGASGGAPNLVVNGGFDDASNWSLGTGWSISGGTADIDGSQTANSLLRQNNVLTIGKIYKIEWDMVSVVGLIRPLVGSSGGVGVWVSGTGHFSQIIAHPIGLDHVYLQANTSLIAEIDNVKVTKQ